MVFFVFEGGLGAYLDKNAPEEIRDFHVALVRYRTRHRLIAAAVVLTHLGLFKFGQVRRTRANLNKIWAEVDSNHRTLAGTDLQSVAFSHSAIYPYL